MPAPRLLNVPVPVYGAVPPVALIVTEVVPPLQVIVPGVARAVTGFSTVNVPFSYTNE